VTRMLMHPDGKSPLLRSGQFGVMEAVAVVKRG